MGWREKGRVGKGNGEGVSGIEMRMGWGVGGGGCDGGEFRRATGGKE